jgi:hypothetical protein
MPKLTLKEAAEKLFKLTMEQFEKEGLTEKEIEQRFLRIGLHIDAVKRKN